MTESIWFTDSLARIHVSPEETDGAYALMEMISPSGHITPPHAHTDSESFLVIDGEITVHTEAGPTVFRAGQAGHIPAGVVHTLSVTSAGPIRSVLVSAPSGFAEYVRACGRPAEREELPVLDGPPDIELLQREAPGHGITVFGPPGMLPADLVRAG